MAKLSPETIEKIRIKRLGSKHSEETKKKISEKMKGRPSKIKGLKINRPSRPRGMWRKNWKVIKKELY